MSTDHEKLYSINYYSKLGAGERPLRRAISCGLPAIERDGCFYIKESDIFAIRKAADEIRRECGKVSILHSKEFAEKAIRYLAEGGND